MTVWKIKRPKADINKMCEDLHILKPLALALSANGYNTRDSVKSFLERKPEFADILCLKDVKKSFEIIKQAIKNNSNICIYGDYDVDGVMSTTILYKGLKDLGANVKYYIPNRVIDGYGLNKAVIKKTAESGTDLLITCDNGIAAVDEVEYAKSLGLNVIIYDHHEPPFEETNGVRKEILPKADAVVDAKISNCGYPFRFMCAGGLCYRLVCALYKEFNKEPKNEEELAIFAAIATNCDIVELIGENRAILHRGLDLINQKIQNPGLRMLIECLNLDHIREYHLGFIIGPTINAPGRLNTASIAVELFITDDSEKIAALSKELVDYNGERKIITATGAEELAEICERDGYALDKVIVVYSESIHESVAGIIAGRLKEKYNRPAIVLTKASEGVKGSGRSIEGYDMHAALTSCKELLTKFGGHAMASGLSLKEENIDKLRKKLNLECTLTPEQLEETFRADGILEFDDVTLASVKELELLRPFGSHNEEPLYASTEIYTRSVNFIGKEGKFTKFVFEDKFGNRQTAIAFGCYEKITELLENNGYSIDNCSQAKLCIDVMYKLSINEYNGNESVQLKIIDLRAH